MSCLCIICSIALLFAFTSDLRAADRECSSGSFQPNGVFLSPQRLATLAQRIADKTEPTYSAWKKLQHQADDALDAQHHAMADWYVPGYYRDAEGHKSAKGGLMEDANRSYILALAWKMTGEKKYANTALRLIDAWPATVKNTSLKDDSTLSFSYHFPAMIFAADILRSYDGWPQTRREAFSKFLREKALPLNTMKGTNNWGNWGIVLTASCASYLKDKELFDSCVQRWKQLTESQIAEDGHLPHEVTRNEGRHGIWYSHFSLMPHTIAAEILRLGGTDLYDYKCADGKRDLRLAYEKLIPWVKDPTSFHYWAGDPKDLAAVGYFSYWEILNCHWPNEDATELLKKHRPMTSSHSAPVMTFTHGGLKDDSPAEK